MGKVSSSYIIKELLNKDIYYFTPKFLAHFLDLKIEKVHNLLKTLERKDLVKRVEKGKYFVMGFEPEKTLSNPFFIGNKIVESSYLSFWNALNFYGFTEQVPRKYFFVTTKRKDPVEFNGHRFRYVKFDAKKFFGYRRIGEELRFLIADKEKSIVDSLFMPRYSGGIEEVFKCLKNGIEEIKVGLIQDYAIKMGSKSLCSRLGYMLEKLDVDAKRLKKALPKGYVKLDPTREKGKKRNKDWKIYENVILC